MNTDIQHTQMMMGLILACATAGVMVVALIGHWLGGVWTTVLATAAAMVLTYQPLIGAPVFSNFKTDMLRRILVAAMPFTVTLMLLSLKLVPRWARVVFVVIGPALLLGWVFIHFDVSVPRQELMLHKIAPLAGTIAIVWLLIEPLAVRSPGAAAPIVVTGVTAGIALLLVLSPENQAGLVGPVIPATAGGALLAALVGAMFKWKISFARGPVLLWLTLTGAIFAFMWLDTDSMPIPFLYWIAAALPLAWIPEIGALHRLKPWKRELLRGLLVLVPVVIGMTLAWKQHSKEAAESGDPYGIVLPPHQLPAPSLPSATPIASTIIPPTIT